MSNGRVRIGAAVVAAAMVALAARVPAAGQCEGWVSSAGATQNVVGLIQSFAAFEGDLVAGGAITSAGGAGANLVARWDGAGWQPMGSGLSGTVYALTVHDGVLYAGGDFNSPFGRSLVRWSKGAGSWQAVGGGLALPAGSLVLASTLYRGDLIVGGLFSGAGAPGPNIGRWNGGAWGSVGGGVLGGAINVMTVHDGRLIVGGSFTSAGGVGAAGIAAWDGAAWQNLGSGVSGGAVRGLAVYNGELIAAGLFTSAGGSPVGYIARWTGTSWQPLGTGLSAPVRGMAVYDGELYVTGDFSSAGGSAAARIARWDGATWRALGTGLSSQGLELSVHRGELVVGGAFGAAGGITTGTWGRWSGTDVPWLREQPAVYTGLAQGAGAAMQVAAAPGYTGVSYRWRRNGVPINDGVGGASPGGGTVSGATAAALAIGNSRPSDAGWYECVVSTVCGEVVSGSSVLTVTASPLPALRVRKVLPFGGSGFTDAVLLAQGYSAQAQWDGDAGLRPETIPDSAMGGGGGTGGGLVDAVSVQTVGECWIDISAIAVDGPSPQFLVRLRGSAAYDPAAYTWVHGSAFLFPVGDLNDVQVTLPGARPYCVRATGGLGLRSVEIQPVSGGAVITPGAISPGTYKLAVSLQWRADAQDPVRALDGMWMLTLACCPADWDGSGAVNSADIAAFITSWLASVNGGTGEADFDLSGTTNSGDISAFLSRWIAAVAGAC